MSCVDDGFVVTSGSQLAVQRALQVSTASDWQTGTEQRKERERERERMEIHGAQHRWVGSGFWDVSGTGM